ncbi:MAG: SMP-30/gluconolactonase/LRE family protein [Chloroflexi bacterium]|nr:SMP-30/gluconolactonase/LRE family protein [Chloroflexota bacterium]
MKLTDLVEAGGPERLTTGYFFTEGPVWMPDGTLIFSDIPGNTMYRWHTDGSVIRFRYPSHSANGNTVDRQGRLITCEHDMRRVSRTEEDGTVVTVADRYRGKRLNSPNDVVVKSDGAVYFTDPVAHSVPQDEVEQECNGVYRALPDGSVERLVDDMAYPNGLAFNPDESVLYVVDSQRQHLRAFEVHADGSLGNSRVHIDLGHPQSGFYAGGPDGMKVDLAGNLFITAADGIWVFQADGSWLGKLSARSDQRHSEPAANLAWGGEDGNSLFVTACSSLYRFQLKVPATNS